MLRDIALVKNPRNDVCRWDGKSGYCRWRSREQRVSMRMPIQRHSLMVIFAGWVGRRQQALIEYLQVENEALKSQLKRGGCDSPTKSGEERRLNGEVDLEI